jgi:hypothetical protein
MKLNAKLSKNNIDKNLILIGYLETKVKGYLIKSEVSSNDLDERVIVVQMATGTRDVMFDDYLYDNFSIQVFGKSIREQKQTAYELGLLAGENITFDYNGKKYQLLFIELSNPTQVFYEDIRRVGYQMTYKIVINEI